MLKFGHTGALSLLASLSVGLSAQAQTAVPVSTEELNSVFQTIEANYAPLRYKEMRLKFSWPDMKNQYLARAANYKTSEDFYLDIAKLLNSFKDAHVSVVLPSTYKRTLPLQLGFAEGRTIVAFVSGELVKAGTCPVEPGDELVLMDGRKPEDLRADFAQVKSTGNPRTDQSYLSLLLTSRDEARGMSAAGLGANAQMKFVSAKTAATFDCSIPWKATGASYVNRDEATVGNEINDAPSATPSDDQPILLGSATTAPIFSNPEHERIQSWAQRASDLFSLQAKIENPGAELTRRMKDGVSASAKGKAVEIGSAKSRFDIPGFKEIKPPFGLGSLAAATGFTAGKFPFNGKTVGYLRIPSYMPKVQGLAVFGIRFFVSRLQKETDYLVIDQQDNPGGSVMYSDWLIKSLVGKLDDARHMRFAIRASEDFVRQYAGIIADIETPPADSDIPATPAIVAIQKRYLPLFKEDFAKVKKAYVERRYLSEPIRLYLISEYLDEVMSTAYETALGGLLKSIGNSYAGADLSMAAVYTKPVYFMTNELDFSGGDATPAGLQDYGRVKTVGVNTSGAGGSVQEYNHRADHSFDFRLTASLMVRPGRKLVENIGVKPDLQIETKPQDFADGFKDYFNRVMTAIDQDQKSSQH